jgi:hypothetical protein
MSTGAIDEARLEEFMGRMVGHMTGRHRPNEHCWPTGRESAAGHGKQQIPAVLGEALVGEVEALALGPT